MNNVYKATRAQVRRKGSAYWACLGEAGAIHLHRFWVITSKIIPRLQDKEAVKQQIAENDFFLKRVQIAMR